ncbi:ABC-F family ATP-binding cassette domain-containing protein [Streptomyces sp. WMMB 322]|uniref:ABC-F family ATP-binding cassette domain-containing protein n=1 Tax=Streptomyces sp. WMMB 322 TaxID=1286821 RepID=UPI0006E16615|nr:ABC-F family ATP-binding cassette domain-containing protein [Streptomyces sp. WMMB 322]SCK36615.1 ATPase components of ABC transporters with duplicated ATPase domains [Streptomyces sp. WMMB 322]
MSATLVAKALTAGHGDRTLFSGLDLVVAPGEVVGLVGVNGAGKSTLLRILAGLTGPEEGEVSLNPPEATVGHLPQEPERRAGETVRAFLERRTGVAAAQRALDESTRALEENRNGAADAYALALERWLALGAADLSERAAEVTSRLGLDVALDRPMTTLSGGQAARTSLASLLLSRYDVFLLDEPTNDLDMDGLHILETFVGGLRAATVLVSHDREFLSRTVDSVLELDLAQQLVSQYGGGYDGYLEERARARRHAREEYEEYARTRAGLEARARQQRGWMDKGVRNARRKMPDNDKNVRNARIEATEKQAAKARQTDRMIERLDAEAVEEPRKEWQLRMEIAAAPRSGSVVATLRGARVRRGDFALGPVDLQIDWRDRVTVTGPNGAGKSTLLAALLGRAELEAGSASLGSGVVIGEVDQARRLFHGEESLLDAFRDAAAMEPEEVRTLLAKFGLSARHVLRPAATLSPGERTRAALALLQGRGVNLLVLDEPTNHLDLPAIEQLESALASYEGTLLLVTHDRRMLEAVRTTRHIEVSGGTVRERRRPEASPAKAPPR